MDARALEQKIEALLSKRGLEFQRDVRVGGLELDFLVSGPSGQRVVLEAKAWSPRQGNTARAKEQASRYAEAVGADAAFVVLPEMSRNYVSDGVVELSRLVVALDEFFEKSGPGKHMRLKKTENVVFAAMPFDRKYDDTFFVAMVPAAEEIGAACNRVDKSEFSGDIVDEIRNMIELCSAVIVDLSESKPNVLYEAGYAHALNKPVVHVCSSPLKDLPFDVRNWNTLPYELGQTSALKGKLKKRLSKITGGN